MFKIFLVKFNHRLGLTVMWALVMFCATSEAQIRGAANSKAPTYKISVDARLLSQYVEHGLAISDRNPALNAAFLYNLGPQFKLGFWGSNISNLSSNEDNFWFKVLAEINIEINKDFVIQASISDDHYYKSSIRNGQVVGIRLDYKSYLGQIEWVNNFQGSKTDAIYLSGGKLFDFRKEFKYGGTLGYTLQNAQGLENYFDFRLLGFYEINNNAKLELGGTATINSAKYGDRADPAIYIAVELSY